jgi:2-polyprenyl-6-methoxyphenol hydroxylase-like FAD-dependent oxidoreductase
VLADATLEIFRRLGIGARIEKEAALPLKGLELYQSPQRPILQFSPADFEKAGFQPYSTHPTRTREILLEEAAVTHSVKVFRGVEMERLTRREKTLEVSARRGQETLSWRTPIVVGDDGGHSRVRKALGLKLRLKNFPLEFLGASGPELPGGKPGTGQVWIDPSHFEYGIFGGVFMPLPESKTAFALLLTSKSRKRLMKNPRQFYQAAACLSPRCREMENAYPFPGAFTVFKRPFGHVSSYVSDGAALMGDAAHPVTPAGGQGANMSVADALVLSQVLLEAFQKNDFSAAQLKKYETLRRPANERSLGISLWAHRVFKFIQFFPPIALVLPGFLKGAERKPETKEKLLRNLSTAFKTTENADALGE